MTTNHRLSSSDRGNGNAIRLEKWIKATPISKVPLNQFGEVAKLSVCRILSIPYSTLGTNKKIKELFSNLDMLVKQDVRCALSSQKQKKGPEDMTQLFKQMTSLMVEHESLNCKLARLQYLEDTGISI